MAVRSKLELEASREVVDWKNRKLTWFRVGVNLEKRGCPKRQPKSAPSLEIWEKPEETSETIIETGCLQQPCCFTQLRAREGARKAGNRRALLHGRARVAYPPGASVGCAGLCGAGPGGRESPGRAGRAVLAVCRASRRRALP